MRIEVIYVERVHCREQAEISRRRGMEERSASSRQQDVLYRLSWVPG